jgi:hypothetical protein
VSKSFSTRTINPGDTVYLMGKPSEKYLVIQESALSEKEWKEAAIECGIEDGLFHGATFPHYLCSRIKNDGHGIESYEEKTVKLPKIRLSLSPIY